MSVLDIKLTTGRPAGQLAAQFQTNQTGKHGVANKVQNFISSLQTGSESGPSGSAPSINIVVQDNATQATGTILFSGASSANDTILINGVTFTCVASGATGNQWNVAGTAILQAAALASAINGSATALVNGFVTAANNGTATCTITSNFYSVAGNSTTIAKGVDGGGVMTVSGARLTGGANDSGATTYSF